MRAGASIRPLLGLVVATITGVAAAFVDTRPRFDDTGLVAGSLFLGGAVAGFLAGRTRPAGLVVLALAAGLPTPIAELAGGGGVAAFAAVLFAGIGVVIGAVGARSLAAPASSAG